MNLFLLVLGVVVLLNGAIIAGLVRDVRLRGRSGRGLVELSLVSSTAPALLSAPLRPSLVLVR